MRGGSKRFRLGAGQLLAPVAVAVDNSTGDRKVDPSAGDVYVVADAVPEASYVYKFGPDGEYLGRVSDKEETVADGRPMGVAVDGHGSVWVDWGSAVEGTVAGAHRPKMVTYADSRGNTRTGEFSLDLPLRSLRAGLAVTPEGDVFVDYEPVVLFEEAEEGGGEGGEEPCEWDACVAAELAGVEEPVHGIEPGALLSGEVDQEDTTGLAVAPRRADEYGEVLLDNATSVSAVTLGGVPIQRFGGELGRLQDGSGVAVDAEGDVFVADAGAGDVDVFEPEPVSAPTVGGLAAQGVSGEAGQLDARVDPRGLGRATASNTAADRARAGAV